MKVEYAIKHEREGIRNEDYSCFVLGGDIGGTHTNLGILGVRGNRPILLFSLHFKSQELNSLIPAVDRVVDYTKKEHDIHVERACFGAAGRISADRDSGQLTNVEWDITTKEILEKTSLKSALLINDFEAIGYGINLLDLSNESDIFKIKHNPHLHNELPKATKAVIGAGTGLGKSILVYSDTHKIYVPIPSEGGHGDFPAQNHLELELLDFIKKKRNIKRAVNYEEVISGRGLEVIYLFLRTLKRFGGTSYTEAIDKSKEKVKLIALYKSKDRTCRETFRLYSVFYARCAKNFVLDTLARGGLYIAGGIASRNKEIFRTKEFMEEFENVTDMSEILKATPVYVIVNYDVGMYGAGVAASCNPYQHN